MTQDAEYSLETLLTGVTDDNRHGEFGLQMEDASATPSESLVRERITSLLEGLPVDSLIVVEQLLNLLQGKPQDQTSPQPLSNGNAQHAFQYPTVAMPASSLSGWIGLLREEYSGDALADSEALYGGD